MALKIAAAQSASFAGDVAANVAHHLQFARVAANNGVQFLVFPELSITGYEFDFASECALDASDLRLNAVRDFASSEKMTIVVGAPTRGKGERLHIAAFAFLPDGSALTYTKQHVHSSEQHVFTNGSGGAMIDVAGERVALAICADITHTEHAASAADGRATVYAAGALISEKGYPKDAGFMKRYASEHGIITLLANHAAPTGGWIPAGKSAIWSPDGGCIATAGTAETLVFASVEGGRLLGGAMYSVFAPST